jgi:hypothetical protein
MITPQLDVKRKAEPQAPPFSLHHYAPSSLLICWDRKLLGTDKAQDPAHYVPVRATQTRLVSGCVVQCHTVPKVGYGCHGSSGAVWCLFARGNVA